MWGDTLNKIIPSISKILRDEKNEAFADAKDLKVRKIILAYSHFRSHSNVLKAILSQSSLTPSSMKKMMVLCFS
jgi:hypothetical protein